MDSRTFVGAILAKIAKEFGFFTKKKRYYKLGKEFTYHFSPQKSQFGDLYYINFSAFVGSAEALDWPPAYMGHIQQRLESLMGYESSNVPALDFTINMDPEVRRGLIDDDVRSSLTKFMTLYESRESIRELSRGRDFASLGITGTAQKYILGD